MSKKKSLAHNKPYEGVFITIEGGEGAGKSTLAKTLAEHLQGKGYPVVKTREPGGSKLSEHIREMLLHPTPEMKMGEKAELFLFLAARAQHLEEVILPALYNRSIVICERFNDSTIAYQGYARNLGMDYVEQLLECAFPTLTPDCTFFLDLDPHLGLQRAREQRKLPLDRVEQEEMQFHVQVRQGFLHLADEYSQRIHVLNAENPPQEVLQEALAILNTLLKPSSHASSP